MNYFLLIKSSNDAAENGIAL